MDQMVEIPEYEEYILLSYIDEKVHFKNWSGK
jgi:hypothetical protein